MQTQLKYLNLNYSKIFWNERSFIFKPWVLLIVEFIRNHRKLFKSKQICFFLRLNCGSLRHFFFRRIPFYRRASRIVKGKVASLLAILVGLVGDSAGQWSPWLAYSPWSRLGYRLLGRSTRSGCDNAVFRCNTARWWFPAANTEASHYYQKKASCCECHNQVHDERVCLFLFPRSQVFL